MTQEGVNPLLLEDTEQGFAPDDGALLTVSQLAMRQLELITSIASKQEEIDILSAQLRNIEERELPDAMLAAGIAELKLENGAKLKVEDGLSLSLPKKNLPDVCEWLTSNGHGDIIRHSLSADIPKGKGSDALRKKITAALTKLGLAFSIDPAVHSGTLKALVREQLEKGANIDLKLFGAYSWKKAQITLPNK